MTKEYNLTGKIEEFVLQCQENSCMIITVNYAGERRMRMKIDDKIDVAWRFQRNFKRRWNREKKKNRSRISKFYTNFIKE